MAAQNPIVVGKGVPVPDFASSSPPSSVWDRISTWASENKAVVYTIAGVAVVVTGAGVAYYLTDSVWYLEQIWNQMVRAMANLEFAIETSSPQRFTEEIKQEGEAEEKG